MTNTTGKIFSITSFGSSHGKAIGAVIDGCPANLELNEKDIQKELDRRRPGTSSITSPRKEKDRVQILSGIFEGKTDGTPITGVVFNEDKRSRDYNYIKNTPRPGHGDYTWIEKYGNYDYNGGGRGSGRVTIGHVIGGAIAKKLLRQFGIKVISHVIQVGDIKAKTVNMNLIEEKANENPVHCADPNAAKEMEELILEYKNKGDSIGGIVETIAIDVPAGLGEPIFGKLDGELAKALMEIGSVKGVEIGFGFDVANSTASQINDEYYIKENNNSDNNINNVNIGTTTNTSGGILGGISNGMPIITRVAVKPTPSISMLQNTVDLKSCEETKIEIKGRHDPCICPRVTVVSESAVAIVLADQMIRSGFINPSNLSQNIDKQKK
ncbi:chorismate synthase [Methanobrevibacter arboriphilus]|jgi:chorismate synthase|uniref:Chorismate synthase n=1 Tax=Methanobrevibacter arboriphilus TaxID=39441 RepID=A0ACA8R1G7_METAZ|nr:chorismate synthase [Methanobrevibacter arboriphilus]MCC7562816.1 chorismate synthase [Methanobrevibacter arboriphilus]BBL61360.1 chorismate synthase [Methanobrevibacter arboriphilus]GLI11306.1 chorismate synthase [Methanobrevibacter arboriphilus]